MGTILLEWMKEDVLQDKPYSVHKKLCEPKLDFFNITVIYKNYHCYV